MKHDICLNGPIPSWDEGLPLGNGGMGCLIWGPLHALRFSMDLAGLWDLTPALQTKRPDFTYQTMCRLVRQQSWAELQSLFDAPYACAAPTKLPVGAFELAGLPEQAYSARLSLQDATAELQSGAHRLRVWLAATTPLLVVEPETTLPVRFVPKPPPYAGASEGPADPLCRPLSALGYPPPERIDQDGLQGFTQKISGGRYYALLSRSTVRNGRKRLLITVQTASSAQGARTACEALLMQSAASLARLRRAHLAWWCAFWAQSAIMLPDDALEQLWYRGTYFLGAGSRPGHAPMPLQGVWTADQSALPPWKGDYHNDLNTQFTYAAYLTSNHLQQGEAFLEHLWTLLPAAKRFAAEFYQTDGMCYPGVMALDGSPLGGWPMYSLSPTNSIWLCRLFYEHYRITGDPEFLRERVWPLYLECEHCIRGLLCETADGTLALPLSSSPEIYDDSPRAWLTPNSSYDLALLRDLYERLIELSALLGEPQTVWRSQLNRLPQLPAEENGALMYAKDAFVRESHRHFSHALAIYPLRQISGKTPQEKACIDRTIAQLESLGTSRWVGFSFVWFALLKIVQRDAEGAVQALHQFYHAFLSPNGFHLNGDFRKTGLSEFQYRPFTLEANCLSVQAVNEMLLYSQNGEIEIFPVIPADWRTCAFRGLRVENGLIVSAELTATGCVTLRLHAKRAGSWYLKNTNQTLRLEKGERRICRWTIKPDIQDP